MSKLTSSWREDAASMAFLKAVSPKTRGIKVSNIITRLNGASPTGVTTASVTCDNIEISNWFDITAKATHVFAATRLLVMNTDSNITLASGTTHTLINCQGTNGGAAIGSAQKLNSA